MTAFPESYAVRHGPSPRSVCRRSKRRALSSDAATYRGASPVEINVTPAAVIGRTSTMRRTRCSRIPWIGNSVAIVRANSLSTAES